MEPTRCPACDKRDLIEGTPLANQAMGFAPKGAGLWALITKRTPLTAWACASCGLVQITAPVDKLRELRGG